MTVFEVLVYFTALATLLTWLSWLTRDACPHTDVVDLGDGTGCCEWCDEIVEVQRRNAPAARR